jgi:L-threonylcarbamoyladenylate synthase
MVFITKNLNLILDQLNQGDVVAIPTETVYGLAADAYCESAIKKVFATKQRPSNHPLIMHVAASWDLSQWVTHIPDYAYALMEACWPGPLTLVLPLKPGSVSPLVTGGQDSIAIRAPAHPLAHELLLQLGKPLVAPSANPFGKISPTTAAHVQHSFPHDNFYVLDGGRCRIGVESTIVSALSPEGYQLLRPGMIHAQQLAAITSRHAIPPEAGIRTPGQLASHYQPEKPVYYTQQITTPPAEAYILSFSAHTPGPLSYQFPHESEHAAYELYYRLRLADQSSAKFILLELPPSGDEWLAVSERMIKAGTPWETHHAH